MYFYGLFLYHTCDFAVDCYFAVEPMFLTAIPDMKTRRGDTIELQLSVIAHPANDVTFQVRLPNNSVWHKDADDTRGDVIDVRLLIRVDHFGQYVIAAINSVGSTEIAFDVADSDATSGMTTCALCSSIFAHTYMYLYTFIKNDILFGQSMLTLA